MSKTKIYLLQSIVAVLTMLVTSCSDKNPIIYIEDIQPNITMRVQDERPIRLQPGDRLDVSVHSRDKELVEMFNIKTNNNGGSGQSQQSRQGAYTVDENGHIEMPIIGSINVKGLSRIEVQNLIKYRLLASRLLRDPIVQVDFNDMKFFTLGEINVGEQEITRDRITLLEAITQVGGLKNTGQFKNVIVLRTTDGKQTPYSVDLTKVSDLYSSPTYYLQQNDIIYVLPTEKKQDETSVIGSQVRSPTFWTSLFTFVVSALLLFSK